MSKARWRWITLCSWKVASPLVLASLRGLLSAPSKLQLAPSKQVDLCPNCHLFVRFLQHNCVIVSVTWVLCATSHISRQIHSIVYFVTKIWNMKYLSPRPDVYSHTLGTTQRRCGPIVTFCLFITALKCSALFTHSLPSASVHSLPCWIATRLQWPWPSVRAPGMSCWYFPVSPLRCCTP